VLKQSKRIKGKDLIVSVLKDGAFRKHKTLALREQKNEFGHNRYAIVLSKKLEKSAVKRNQKRRQIYNAIYELEKEGDVLESRSFDIVILAREACLKIDFLELKSALKAIINE
jgi:ribonuclease P protein component